MTHQSIILLSEWNATAKNMLNPSYVLDSSRSTQVAEKFDGNTYSRIHRANNDSLILEERAVGSMYPSCWLIEQDFSDLEAALFDRKKNKL